MGNRLRGASPQSEIPVEGVDSVRVMEPAGMMFDPSLRGWDIIERNADCNVWRDSKTGNEIQEYRIVANDEFQFVDYQKSFKIRFRSNSLVSSIFFKDESTSELCAKYYKGNLYLERIPLRLSDITEIPYPDVLHLYSQCFLGFAELFDLVGYFDITEQMIVVNSLGVVKVWHNKHLDRYLPVVSYHNGNEREMVLKVVRIISQNTNQLTLPDRVSDWVIRSDPYTFKDAWNSIEGYASRYNSNIPESLSCVINFLGLRYVEEEEIHEADFDFDIPMLAGEALNRVVGGDVGGQPYADEYHQQQQIHITQRPPEGYRKIISQSLFPNSQKRRILQHKQYPIVPSHAVGVDPVTGRIPLGATPVKVQSSTTQHKVVYGHHPQPHTTNIPPVNMQSSNPFQSVLQKLQISNHYQPKTIAEISSLIRVPEKDTHGHHPHPIQNPYVTIAGVPPTNSLYTPPPPVIQSHTHTNRYQGRYNVNVSPPPPNPLQQGKSSQQILSYLKTFKQSKTSQPNYSSYKQSQYQSMRQYPVTTSTATFNPPLPIISESPSGAVYKDIGDTSNYVNLSYRNNNEESSSVSFKNNYSVVEHVEKKTVYVEESVRQGRGGGNVDEEIRRDLMRFRSSKASRSSEVR